MQASPADIVDALTLALALPFIPVGVATLAPVFASMAGFAGYLLF